MLYLKKSKIPRAGKGLFTKEKFTRGDIVCEYEGEILPWSECLDRAEQGYEGYVFYITRNRCIDAYFTPEAVGRYANDAKGFNRVEGLRNNAQYEIKTREGEKRVFIVATRTIHPGDEVLVDYGDDYWKNLIKANPHSENIRRHKNAGKKKKKKSLKYKLNGSAHHLNGTSKTSSKRKKKKVR